MDKKIFVERETYEKNGKQYFTYFIKGVVRGIEARVQLMPPDFTGYTVLDIVFGNDNTAELVVTPYEIKDEKTGKVVSGNTYGVRSFDEDGEVYECKIQPFKSSDRALLNMLIR